MTQTNFFHDKVQWSNYVSTFKDFAKYYPTKRKSASILTKNNRRIHFLQLNGKVFITVEKVQSHKSDGNFSW
jgi:hypothetical protein